MTPEVSEEDGSSASSFYHWFLERLKELSFTSRGFARFN